MHHTYICAVRWGDMDAVGHVNNAAYSDFLQEARIDLLRGHAAGAPTNALEEATLVVSQHISYHASLIFDGRPVAIDVWVAEIKAATFTLAYEMYREDEHGRTVFATAQTVLAPFSFATQRPRRITAEERADFERYLDPVPVVKPSYGAAVLRPEGHYPVAVRFSDLDAYGHANNVIYLEYFQEARIELLARIAELPQVAHEPRAMVVVRAQDVEYKRQVALRPEPYDSWTWVTAIGNTSMTMEAQICDTDGSVLARGQFVMVFIDPATGSAAKPSPAYREVLLATGQLGNSGGHSTSASS